MEMERAVPRSLRAELWFCWSESEALMPLGSLALDLY